MGTRSITVLMDNKPTEEIAVMYRQYDGYPAGMGAELAAFLQQFRIVNGYSSQDKGRIANGGSCLAAQLIAHFKDGVGNVYLYPAGTRGTGEEYIYTVFPQDDGTIRLKVQAAFFGLPVLFDRDVRAWNTAQVAEADKRAHNDYLESRATK